MWSTHLCMAANVNDTASNQPIRHISSPAEYMLDAYNYHGDDGRRWVEKGGRRIVLDRSKRNHKYKFHSLVGNRALKINILFSAYWFDQFILVERWREARSRMRIQTLYGPSRTGRGSVSNVFRLMLRSLDIFVVPNLPIRSTHGASRTEKEHFKATDGIAHEAANLLST